jgi:hypothetical protein
MSEVSVYQPNVVPDLGEPYRTLCRGYGLFMNYNPHTDGDIDRAERDRIKNLGEYDNMPEDFKVHISPQDEQLHDVARIIIDRCRDSWIVREALHEMKFWFGPNDEEYEDMPRVVLYPRESKIVNVIRVFNGIMPRIVELGIEGSGREPRFNMPIVEGFCYLAQGSGSKKEDGGMYPSLFDPKSNHAFQKEKGGTCYTLDTLAMLRRNMQQLREDT